MRATNPELTRRHSSDSARTALLCPLRLTRPARDSPLCTLLRVPHPFACDPTFFSLNLGGQGSGYGVGTKYGFAYLASDRRVIPPTASFMAQVSRFAFQIGWQIGRAHV